ncbi:MAG: hypothetical protein ACLFMT_06430 [Halobacteriales archaeon]
MARADSLIPDDRAELDRLFERGDTPEIDALEGDTVGRVLAGRGLLGITPLRRGVNGPHLPWRGKRVRGTEGCNRFGYGPLEREGFGFKIRHAPSLADPEKTVLIFDYDVPDNPAPVRRIRDDLVEIEDGLYLGTSNLRVGDDYRFLTYFTLEHPE